MNGKILEILKELQPTFDFEDGKNFVDAGYLDSFDIVQLVAELEEVFDISISALDIVPENFSTIHGIADLVVRCQKS